MLSDTTQARAIRAVGAFGALGEIGGGAVPELTKRLYAPGQSGAAWVHAVTALKNLGAVGVPPIIGALTNSGPGCVRLLMMMHLEGLEMKYPQVVAALEDLLTDGDPDVRYWATNGLLQLIYDPEPVVRATMANALRKTDPKKLGTWRQK